MYYPMFVDLRGRLCVVIGGGKVAERKIAKLVEAGAVITIISPEATERIQAWAQSGRVRWFRRGYEPTDLTGAALIIAATNVEEVNDRVTKAARESGQWINRADKPETANVILPSVVQRGKLQIAVSTSGASPILTRQIAIQLEEQYGTEYERAIDWLALKRKDIQRRIKQPEARQAIWKALFNLNPVLWIVNHKESELDAEAERLIGQVDRQEDTDA